MNVENLHKKVKLKDTPIGGYFRSLIDSSQYYGKYRLLNRYLFRTDSLRDMIESKNLCYSFDDSDCIKDGKINYMNRHVRRYVDENSYLYVGNAYFEKYGFCPVFLSFKIRSIDWNSKNDLCIDISGYSINIGDERDQFYFNDKTTKSLGKMKESYEDLPLKFASTDLKSRLDEICKMTERRNRETC